MRHALEGEATGLPPELREAWAKLDRAHDHRKAFKAAYDAFLDSQPYRVVAQFESEAGCYVARIRIEGDTLPLSVMIGDIAHNLRSALDFVAWQAAIKHLGLRQANRNRGKIAFPITDNERAFECHDAIPFFADDAKAVFEQLQPYRREDRVQDDVFWLLRTISNADKHRAVQRSFTALDMGPVTFRRAAIDTTVLMRQGTVDMLIEDGGVFEHGTKVAHIRFAEVADPQTTKVDVTGQPTARVLFGEGPFEGGLGPNSLAKLVTEVGLAFNDFLPLFPR